MKPVEHFASFKDGKIQCKSFAAAVREFAAKGCAVVLTIEEFKEKRSNTANAYYWAAVVDGIHRALKESGWEITKEGTHEMLRFRFLREDRPIGEDGEFITTVRSTTELDRQEFGDYIEACARFAAEYLNTVIPAPNEQVALEV